MRSFKIMRLTAIGAYKPVSMVFSSHNICSMKCSRSTHKWEGETLQHISVLTNIHVHHCSMCVHMCNIQLKQYMCGSSWQETIVIQKCNYWDRYY